MNKEELIIYAIRTSEAIKEEKKQELIDYASNLQQKNQKYKEVIDKAMEYIKEKQKIQYKFALSQIECDDLLQILEDKEVSE